MLVRVCQKKEGKERKEEEEKKKKEKGTRKSNLMLCLVGYDGKSAYALERACRAITRGYNLVDMSRRSLTYESRLYKYSKRGFAVAIPGFDRLLLFFSSAPPFSSCSLSLPSPLFILFFLFTLCAGIK